jgi:hypothetical protein
MFNGYNELENHHFSWVNQPFTAFLMENQVSKQFAIENGP